MTLIQVCMPDVERAAPAIIAVMEKILHMRKQKRIRRKVFLLKWKALRIELGKTKEYRDFLRVVRDRAKGKCQSCNAIGRDVHHRRRVALAPRLAIRPSNGVLLCRSCHKSQPGHRHLGHSPAHSEKGHRMISLGSPTLAPPRCSAAAQPHHRRPR